jgi:hypothetical protein
MDITSDFSSVILFPVLSYFANCNTWFNESIHSLNGLVSARGLAVPALAASFGLLSWVTMCLDFQLVNYDLSVQ